MDGTNMPICSLLEQAANVVRRKKRNNRNAWRNRSHKRGQIEALISFANENQLWFSCSEKNLCYFSKGGENEVYANDSELIFKLNNFEYAGDDLENLANISKNTQF